MCFGVSHAHVAAFPCWSVACWGEPKDKAPEPNRNKISVLDARLLGSVQDPKRRSLIMDRTKYFGSGICRYVVVFLIVLARIPRVAPSLFDPDLSE